MLQMFNWKKKEEDTKPAKKKGKKKGKKQDKKRNKRKSKGKDGDKSNPNNVDDTTASTSFSSDASNSLLEEVMKDNLDLMREVVMRIREDEDYAKTIYADCPRLQHLLDQHPDLRPVFEDPNLVRINFEHVYRKCGGVLPEDRPSCIMRTLACIVKHPLFKVFRVLLFIKKCYTCIFNGGFLMIKNCLVGIFTGDFSPEVPEIDDIEDIGSPENAASKEALIKAAEHFEEPDVQDQIDALLEGDADDLEEAIEQDPDLKALRATNPLCAELMSDPSTLKILVDPDNLRALAECPDLIEADFVDPNWSPPDVESIPFDDPAYADADRVAGMIEEPDLDPDVEPENDGDNEGEEDEEGEEEEEEEGFLDEFERGDESEPNAAAKKGQQKKQQNNKKKEGNGGGFLSTIGTGLVDYIAAETVGVTASEMMGGDDFGVDELEDQVDEIADEAEDLADDAEDAVTQAEQLMNAVGAVEEMAGGEDLAENVEGAMDEVEDTHDDKNEKSTVVEDAVTDGALGTATAMGVAGEQNGDKERSGVENEEKGEEEEGAVEEKKKSRFGRFGSALGEGFGALGAAAKEFAITAVIGEDLAEEVLDQMEDESEEEDDEDDKSSKSDGSNSDTENKGMNEDKNKQSEDRTGSQSSLFRRRNK